MTIKTEIDPETASIWTLHLEIPAHELATAEFNEYDRQIIENAGARNKISDVLLAATLMAIRIEQVIERYQNCSEEEQ
jgi:hypothetical protein